MDFIKKNISLVVGIAIPIIMILFVACSIYLPGLFIQPKFNFLYVSGDDTYAYGQNQYTVENNQLIKNELPATQGKTAPTRPALKLYVYNVTLNTSREVSFEEAQQLQLDANSQSPDGFTIVYGSRGDDVFPLFWGGGTDYSARYLQGHNVSKKLNLQLNGGSYYSNFRFIGWIH